MITEQQHEMAETMITEEQAESLHWLSQGMASPQSQTRIANLFYRLLEEGRLVVDTLDDIITSRHYTEEWGDAYDLHEASTMIDKLQLITRKP